MAVLEFTLSDDGVTALRDVLSCLNKFSDDVFLEAKRDQFVLSTINLSKSAYGNFSFATARFFSRYRFEGNAQFKERFYCTLPIRTLIAIFRNRSGGDGGRDPGKQTTIERCDVSIEDGSDVESRFTARFIFRNGLSAMHRIPFESVVPVHAKFNRSKAVQNWTIPSRTIRQLMEHVGRGTDLLDVNTDEHHINFTCFTEKPLTGDEVLRKPLQTSIAVDMDEFESLEVERGLHITVVVKDFRAAVHHAALVGASITARYSDPAQPIQLAYQGDGLACEFVLMTVGERTGNPGQRTKKTAGKVSATSGTASSTRRKQGAASRKDVAAPEPVQQATGHSRQQTPSRTDQDQAQAQVQPQDARPSGSEPSAPPRATASRFGGHFELRPSEVQVPTQRPMPSLQPDSLFVDQDNEWEPLQEEDEDEEQEDDARLGWDYGEDRNTNTMSRMGTYDKSYDKSGTFPQLRGERLPETAGMEPTQRLEEVRRLGLFSDGL